MKKTLSINIFLIVLFFCVSESVFSQCKSKSIVKGCKQNLTPFKYSGAAINEFVIDEKAKKVEVEFTAYGGQEYRLIFCSSANFSEDVKINIYDKRKNVKSRKLIYDTSSGIDNLFWVFEPPKTGNYFIEYEIPESVDDTKKEACMMLIIGYQNIAKK